MSKSKLFLLASALVIGLAGSTVTLSSHPTREVRMENLMKQALDEEFTPGREIVVSHVEIPPNTRLDWHWHPGEEFHYYMEGEVKILIEGHPPIHGKPGVVGHVPYKAVHTAVTGDKGATVVVFRVHQEGQPVRFLEEDGASER